MALWIIFVLFCFETGSPPESLFPVDQSYRCFRNTFQACIDDLRLKIMFYFNVLLNILIIYAKQQMNIISRCFD